MGQHALLVTACEKSGDRLASGRAEVASPVVDVHPYEFVGLQAVQVAAVLHGMPQRLVAVVESVLGPGYRLQAKWPNDLLHDGRKLAGILVEIVLSPRPYAIVGIGLNVNLRHEELPPDLQPIATSLYELLGCESSRWFLLGQIVQGFLRHFPDKTTDFSPVLDWIRPRDLLAGTPIMVRSGRDCFEGFARGIGDEGELLLEKENGEFVKIVSAEEIRWR